MHIPQGIVGWGLFGVGLLMIAYRIHGIDAPRAWVESLERQFTYSIRLRFIGGLLLLAALALAYLGRSAQGLAAAIFIPALALLGIVGLCLALLQNHMRHLVLASAEGSDTALRVSSIIIVLLGLGLSLVPFFY